VAKLGQINGGFPLVCFRFSASFRPLRVESLYLTLADAGPGGQLLPKIWNHTVHGSV
jgi:hypothetical protein